MLYGINTGGRYLQVTGGSSPTYINKSYSSNAKMVGDMMYDVDSQCIKVFDGSSWQSLVGSVATVELTYEAQSLLDWARKKKDEDMLLEKQAQENPAIKDLVEQIKLKQEQIKMVQTLIKSPGHDAGLQVPMQAP
jgi:hypothetical protein